MAGRSMGNIIRCLLLGILIFVVAGCAGTMTGPRVFEDIRHDPVRLRIFLSEMPKGGDLHNHLSGMMYAEDYIRWAARGGLCLDLDNACTVVDSPCKGNAVPASRALTDSGLWNRAINAFSTRQARRGSFMWGHDQFFATFGRFDQDTTQKGDMLAEAARMAAQDRVMYLELMLCIYPSDLWSLAQKAAGPLERDDLAEAYTVLSDAGLFDRSRVLESRRLLSAWEESRDEILQGGSGSEVQFRYINQVIRVLPPEAVFAQIAYSFALASEDPRVVALNLVAPEDHPVSMSNYGLHMDMIDYLYRLYRTDPDKRGLARKVNITLHAGELTLGLVEPEGLRNHIRLAVEKGHAQRIGHGVDLSYEDRPYQILETMRERGIAVEVLLTSNHSILGVSGDHHPLNLYMEEGVPFALATDDMGVARSDMTNEFLRAVLDQGLGYQDLEASVRNSVEYSFLPGDSLWADYKNKVMVSECRAGQASQPGEACSVFLESSEKAALQWKLEQRLEAFLKRWERGRP